MTAAIEPEVEARGAYRGRLLLGNLPVKVWVPFDDELTELMDQFGLVVDDAVVTETVLFHYTVRIAFFSKKRNPFLLKRRVLTGG